MSNMKVVAMINEQARREQAEIAAVAQDLYAALQAERGSLQAQLTAERAANVVRCDRLQEGLCRVFNEKLSVLKQEIEQLRADHDRLESNLTGDGR